MCTAKIQISALIRISIGCILDNEGCKVSSCGERWLWSDWAGAQADLCLPWAHMPECVFLSFRLNSVWNWTNICINTLLSAISCQCTLVLHVNRIEGISPSGIKAKWLLGNITRPINANYANEGLNGSSVTKKKSDVGYKFCHYNLPSFIIVTGLQCVPPSYHI